MALALIELQKVRVLFSTGSAAREVFASLDLQIEEASSVVLVGPSGQGKSVLLKLMAGLLKPTEGQVHFRGKDLQKISRSQKAELMHDAGMLFQRNALFDSMTCGENIAFPLREVTDLSEDQIAKTVDEFLEAVGLSQAKSLFPDEISGGMQKRLGIARALAVHPKVIFYDDPTAGLDPITSKKIIDLILQFRMQEKATIVSVTNDMNRAFQLASGPADKIYLVQKGQLLLAGNADAARKTTNLELRGFLRGEVAVDRI